MPSISPYDSNYFESNIDASDLQAVISLRNIKSLTLEFISKLNALGVFTVSDLIRYKPIHDAKFLLALDNGEIVHEYDFSHLADSTGKSLKELLESECVELKSVSVDDNIILKTPLGISNIRSLANYSIYDEALELIEKSNNIFNETPSAPNELIPKIKGNVQSQVKYVNYVRESTVKLPVSLFSYDKYTDNVSDDLLQQLFIPILKTDKQENFIEQFIKIQLGYIAEFKQNWAFINTQLGEIVHSLALAPGESRNIAIIDWKHSQTTSKNEKTGASEQLSNSFIHSRALSEITDATARENQYGNTTAEGGTIGGSLSFAKGSSTVAGSADKGSTAGVADSTGLGAVISGGYSKGTVIAKTHGDRDLHGQLSQNITDTVSQLASNLRSLWSVVVAEDNQTENRQINTRNVTNYNHNHALTIQYYEVLHRYRAETKLNNIVPILYLPYSPLPFSIELIVKYWSVFKNYLDAEKLKRYEPVVSFFNSGKAEYNPSNEYHLIQIQIKIKINFSTVSQTPTKLEIPGIIREVMSDINFNNPYQEIIFQSEEPSNSTSPITTFKKIILYAKDATSSDIFIRLKFINENGEELIKEVAQNGYHFFPDDNGTGGRYQKAEYLLEPNITSLILADDKPSATVIKEFENYFSAKRYFFTSLLLQNAEQQQLIDLIQGIIIQTATHHIYLCDLIDFSPVGVSDNYILFKLKRFEAQTVATSPTDLMHSIIKRNEFADEFAEMNFAYKEQLKNILNYFDEKISELKNANSILSSADIYLPTSGIFAEAILGRSNASEKIDITRFYNWQDSPIPHLAPQISNVDPNIDLTKQPLNTNSNLPSSVLNYFNTPNLPDPTGMTAIMQAIQNGNMFRDMSKSETILGVLTNLSNFSTELAKLSSTMAGDAQKTTLTAATDIAKSVLNALPSGSGSSGTGSVAGSGNGDNGEENTTTEIPVKAANTITEKGGALNVLEQSEKDGAISKEDAAKSKALTAGATLKGKKPPKKSGIKLFHLNLITSIINDDRSSSELMNGILSLNFKSTSAIASSPLTGQPINSSKNITIGEISIENNVGAIEVSSEYLPDNTYLINGTYKPTDDLVEKITQFLTIMGIVFPSDFLIKAVRGIIDKLFKKTYTLKGAKCNIQNSLDLNMNVSYKIKTIEALKINIISKFSTETKINAEGKLELDTNKISDFIAKAAALLGPEAAAVGVIMQLLSVEASLSGGFSATTTNNADFEFTYHPTYVEGVELQVVKD